MSTDILSRLRSRLADAERPEIERVADEMGVPRGTLRKIVSGVTTNPRYLTVERIRAYLSRRRDQPSAR